MLVEPLVKFAADRRAFCWDEKRSLIEGGRELGPMRCGQFRSRKEGEIAFAQKMVESSDTHRRAHWRIGKEQIESVDGEFREQVVIAPLVTDDMNLVRELKRRQQQTVSDQFGQDIGHPDGELKRAVTGPAAYDVLEFPSDRKNFFSEAENRLAEFGQHEVAPDSFEELSIKRLLELLELLADRGMSQVQLLGSSSNAAFPRHHPEIKEVVVIEPVHDVAHVSDG